MKIFLIGLRGVGKTTVGEKLAARLQLAFYDTDRMIEEVIGLSVKEIFLQHSEIAFRDYETTALRKLQTIEQDAVVATGGGVILRPENQVLLPKMGKVVYLFAKPEKVIPRLRISSKRPSLSGQPLEKETEFLFLTRDPIYRDIADLEIAVEEKTPEEICEEIALKLPRIKKRVSKNRKRD